MLKAVFRVTTFVALTSLLVACGDESKEIPDDIGHFELGDVNDVADTAEVAEDITDTEEVADDEDPGDTEEVADDAADTADTDDVPPEDTTEVVEPEPDPALPMRDDGWLRGDLHMHTTYSDGEDPVAVVIALAEYFQTELFLDYHPEYVGNHIDFISITDHRTVLHNFDPDFHSDSVIVIRGMEFGKPGHGNIFDLEEFVPHEIEGVGATPEVYQAAPGLAHAQGALFSINHPMLINIPFPWDVRDHDAMEIINVGWGMLATAYPLEKLDAWEQRYAPASPIFKKALEYSSEGGGGNAAALRFYEAQLTRGLHVAVVAGSDRHLVLPVGFPTTWIKTESEDIAGIKDGIRARHTFVSRTPVAATVEMTVKNQDETYAMGDQINIGEEAEATLEVTIRVRRAQGARVRLIRGVGVDTDEALADVELGAVVHEDFADSNDFETTVSLTVNPGDWFYPVVHERLISPDLDPELAALIPGMADAMEEFSEENFSPLLDVLVDFIDSEALMRGEDCRPTSWEPHMAQCMPPDNNGLGTFFIPDWINRVFSIIREDGKSTDWCMGAIGSACVVKGVEVEPMP
ncbi:MAG TPA: CehA/McbA family metallohydrolase [Myxococcota bacterium]|nr:CehA/McbA family metallohydrolase [Myxococcota bacterium]HPL24221.1 CehA/McbA family metallohydrolase [Myxococcota bacterium]HQI61147.1 CehA/McbA family metallohydrolase [Myxococcota bacterium]